VCSRRGSASSRAAKLSLILATRLFSLFGEPSSPDAIAAAIS
jgi:hypothetical protein